MFNPFKLTLGPNRQVVDVSGEELETKRSENGTP